MGYGLVEEAEGEIAALTWGVLAPGQRLPLGHRLHLIHAELLELMERWEPTEVAVEEPFVSQNPRTAIAIGQAQAVALVAAASRGIDAARYAPGEVKRAVTGYGGSSKEQIQRSVCIQLDIEDSDIPEDAADALAVALCHIRARTEKQMLAQG